MEEIVKKINFLIAALLLCTFVAGCGPSCDVEGYLGVVTPYLEDWDDTNATASSTARTNLSGPIGEMQDIKRDVEDLEVEPCLEDAHANLVTYMERTIDAYIAFMNNEDDELVQSTMETADSYLLRYDQALRDLLEE
jgi:hypothetical protein